MSSHALSCVSCLSSFLIALKLAHYLLKPREHQWQWPMWHPDKFQTSLLVCRPSLLLCPGFLYIDTTDALDRFIPFIILKIVWFMGRDERARGNKSKWATIHWSIAYNDHCSIESKTESITFSAGSLGVPDAQLLEPSLSVSQELQLQDAACGTWK